MPASRMTFLHFAASVLNCAAHSSGALPIGSNPSVAIRSFMSGSAMILTISPWSSAMISLGVRAGTITANHASPSMSGYPASAIVGTSGSACNRVLLATASARSLPSLTCGTTGGGVVKAIGVWPATVEPIAKPALLKGICTRSRPSDRRNNSPTRCPGVPVPGEAKVYLPGWALMKATRSLTDCTGSALIQGRIDDDGGRNHEHGIAVGRCLCPLTHTDVAASTANVFDIELFSETLGQLLCDEASEYVGRTAGRERNDHTHRPRRIGLRARDPRDGRQRGSAGGQMQKLSAVRKFHFEPPSSFTSLDHLVGERRGSLYGGPGTS